MTGKVGVSKNSLMLLQNGRSFPLNHQIYVKAKMRCNIATGGNFLGSYLQISGSGVFPNTAKTTDFVTCAGIFTATENNETYPMFGTQIKFAAAQDLDGVIFESTEPVCVDLTAAFGAGNEPDKAWCDAHIPFFAGTTKLNM